MRLFLFKNNYYFITCIVCIEFLDEELQNEERVIEYLVRDEIGALASTLQVISVSISGYHLAISIIRK